MLHPAWNLPWRGRVMATSTGSRAGTKMKILARIALEPLQSSEQTEQDKRSKPHEVYPEYLVEVSVSKAEGP